MRSIRLPAVSTALATAVLGLGAGAASATAAPKLPCFGGIQHHPELTTGWPGFPAQLVKGGPAVESTVTFKNTAGREVKDFRISLYVAYLHAPLPAGSFAVELKAPGGDWKKVDFGTGDFSSIINSGMYQLPKDATLTLGLRIAATSAAPVGNYQTTESGGSAVLDEDTDTFLTEASAQQPAAKQDGTGVCTQYVGYGTHDFAVVDSASTATATPTRTATATAGAPTTPAATPTTAAPTTAAGTTQAARRGAELAETGASSTVPVAVGGATALVLGGGILVALRRRRGSHS
ncbi:LAETG motif-containing sortase-dependent surface protein [Kitasatospora sp. NPDC048365]|uniref:LAETG motif-containing sortase-dependent surface protein n=1 Tax=Kitasatospora sp. NPDC048365 TaxID=3364050 RepID=UPI0037220BBB